MSEPTSPRSAGAGVQTLGRALDVVEAAAAIGGYLTISELAETTRLPQPTVHRLLQTLVARGYMRQLPDRRYALGFRLVPLGAAAGRLVGTGAERVLTQVVHELGETANLAILSGDSAEYVAQAPSRHAMRMFTEVGRRVDLHATGVGKALLAQLPDEEVEAVLSRTGLAAHTVHTITALPQLRAVLVEARERGYVLDEQEQELGVRCVAVALPTAAPMVAAMSVSGPLTRMDDALVARAVPVLRAAAGRLEL